MMAKKGFCLLNALILVCTVLVTPDLHDCNDTNARIVIVAPEEFASPVTCAMYGQAYVAGTSIGRKLGENDRVKIVCRPHRSPGASIKVLNEEPRD